MHIFLKAPDFNLVANSALTTSLLMYSYIHLKTRLDEETKAADS